MYYIQAIVVSFLICPLTYLFFFLKESRKRKISLANVGKDRVRYYKILFELLSLKIKAYVRPKESFFQDQPAIPKTKKMAKPTVTIESNITKLWENRERVIQVVGDILNEEDEKGE